MRLKSILRRYVILRSRLVLLLLLALPVSTVTVASGCSSPTDIELPDDEQPDEPDDPDEDEG